jgi:hypothetical protein
MWDLFDLKTPRSMGGKTFLSAKTQREYECIEESMRVLATTSFSAHMGES